MTEHTMPRDLRAGSTSESRGTLAMPRDLAGMLPTACSWTTATSPPRPTGSVSRLLDPVPVHTLEHDRCENCRGERWPGRRTFMEAPSRDDYL